jgi:phosphate/phosphite/phosphonate ABC transporter binding protein
MRGLVAFAVLWGAVAFGQVKLGVLPRLAPAEMNKMMAPLAKQMEAALGQPVQVIIPKDFKTFTDQAKAGEYDFAYANPSIFAGLSESAKARALVVTIEKGTGKSFTGCFVVKADSPYKTVADLKGKKLIFVDEQSTAGYQLQVLALKKAGVNAADFTRLPFGKKHTNVMMAVANGTADAGGVRTVEVSRVKTELNLPIRVLAETDAVPTWPVFVFPKAEAQADKVKAALLKLKTGDEALSALRADGFAPSSNADYAAALELTRL